MVESTGASPVRPSASSEPSTAELVTRLSEQSGRLLRDELRLAQAELSHKAKKAGVGAGMFATAAVLALFGLGVVVTTAILALALVLPAWLAALIVAVVLLAAAGIAAMLGRRRFSQAGALKPERTIESLKRDIDEVKEEVKEARS